jgi:hypothetical protein
MWTLAFWMARRFLRLGLWVLALAVPMALLLGAAAVSDDAAYHVSVLFAALSYVMPVVATLFVLTSVRRAHWTLILTRRTTPLALVSGVCLGAMLPLLACQALLLLGAVGLERLRTENTGGPPASVYYSEWTAWREGAGPRAESRAPFWFRFPGVERTGGPLEATVRASVGRFVAYRARPQEGEAGHRTLYRGGRVRAGIRFAGGAPDGAAAVAPLEVVLHDHRPARFLVPASAVGADGVVELAIERLPDAAGGAEAADAPAAAGQPVGAHQHEHEEPGDAGPVFFWFAGGTNDNGIPLEGVLLERRKISFLGNFVRAGLQAAALVTLVSTLAAFATVLFSRAVALAVVATVYVIGNTHEFLREVIDSLAMQSAVFLLHGRPHAPTGFDLALQRFLEFWLAVLPDFSIAHGARFLFAGEAIRWPTVFAAHGVALLYAVALVAVAATALMRWEVRR